MVKIKGSTHLKHVVYICDNCLKNFGCRKYDYLRHLNNAKQCKKNNNQDKNDENIILDNKKSHNDILECRDDNSNHNNIFKNINDKSYENNDLIIEFMKKINNDILNLNDIISNLNNKITKLEEDNEKLKNQLILFNNKSKNTNYTLNLQINNFNDTKDFRGNFNNLLNEQGKNIFLKTIENVFLNPEKPENHNIYVSDKNRKQVKIYNDGRWNTKKLNTIDEIINNVVDFYKLSIEKIKEDQQKYEKLKTQINNKIKYVEYCDLEFLEELRDEQQNDNINNETKINRCCEFRKMVYDEIIILFHDKKDIVLETHKNRLSNKKIDTK